MHTFFNRIALLLLGALLVTACSRPYATYRPTTAESFRSAPMLAPVTIDKPAVAITVATTTPVTPTVALQQQLNEAVASNKAAVSDRKVQKRLARVSKLLSASEQKTAPASARAIQKMTAVQKVILQKMNRTIQKRLAPTESQTNSRALRVGIVIAVIGLILLIVGNSVLGALGYVALIVGLGLVVLALLDVI
jgi:heme O synthase-like polyprenyltransferase